MLSNQEPGSQPAGGEEDNYNPRLNTESKKSNVNRAAPSHPDRHKHPEKFNSLTKLDDSITKNLKNQGQVDESLEAESDFSFRKQSRMI